MDRVALINYLYYIICIKDFFLATFRLAYLVVRAKPAGAQKGRIVE